MRRAVAVVGGAMMVMGLGIGPAAAQPQGNANGQGVLNKPACEAVSLLGANGEWANDRGIKSCTFSYEFRALDLTYEMEQEIARIGELPGVLVTVTQEGALRVTLDLDVLVGASQRGNVGAPGTLDTRQGILEVTAELNAWWEDCQTRVVTQGQLPPFFGITFPVTTISDVTTPAPDELCTAALIGGLLDA